MNPGAGGWPTLRYYNADTGPGGAPVERITNQKICDEFKIPQRMILCTNQPVGRVLCVDGVRRREFLIYAQA